MTLARNTLTPTAEQKKTYNENGFLVVEGIFNSGECDEILAVCKRYADDKFAAILNLDRKENYLRELMKLPRVVSFLEGIQGQELVALMSQVLFKEVGSPYASQAWQPHQDNSYPQTKGAYFTINIALADMDLENGCLYMYPGSHREGIFPYEPVISYRETPGSNPGNVVESSILKRFPKVDLPIKKGGMLVLHGDCIHGSYPNVSTTRSRPLFSVSYIAKGADFLVGKNANRIAIDLHS